MSARNDGVHLNNGGNLLFGTYMQTYPSSTFPNIAIFNAEGVAQVATVLNLIGNSNLRSLPIKTSFPELSTLMNSQSQESIESSEWQTVKNDFESSVYFLWGSLDAGGCFVYRTGTAEYRFGGVSGFYANTDSTYFRYGITVVNRPYMEAGLNDICFLYDGASLTNSQPTINIFSTSGLRGGRGEAYYNVYSWQGSFQNWFYLEKLMDMSVFVSQYTWSAGVLNDKPDIILVYDSEHSPATHFNLNNPILGDFLNPSEWHRISGDTYGGENYDPEDEPEDADGNGGNSSQQGGYGDYPSNSGNIGYSDPTGDTNSVIGSGFVTLYNPTKAQLSSFSEWLFSDASFTSQLANIVKRLVADPMDFVLFIALCRFNPPTNLSDNIKYCGISTGVSSKLISNQYVKLDLGSVYIGGDTNTFLDYNPNTKAQLYLPYINYVDIDIDNIIGSTVSIQYIVDLMNGNCVAEVKCVRGSRRSGDTNLNDVLYSFQGNCYELIPVTGTDWRGSMSAMIQGIMGVGSIIGGNAGGVSQVASAVLSDKVSVSHSGSIAGSFGYMAQQRAHIILTRPVNANPEHYNHYKGYVSNITTKLSSIKGYTEIEPDTLRLENFDSILKEEGELLKSVLSKGVIF